MSSIEHLVTRLDTEVAKVKERIHTLQTEATKVYLEREHRFMQFMDLTKHIHQILQPRIEIFKKLNVFKTLKQSVSLELLGPEERGFHGKKITISIPTSDACSGKVELSFRLGHDGLIENALFDYHLEILPIFIKFESHDQLVIPIDDPSEEAIAAWIDDKLVGFTKTYFEMYFTEQYHLQSFELDPVMRIRFPRAFAAGKIEYQGQRYYFYTNESLQDFETDPSKFVASG